MSTIIPTQYSSPNGAFRAAVEAIEGGQSALSKLIGKTQSAISKRLAAGEALWAETVLAVEAATGVSRHDLRPDIYPREDGPAQPPAAGVAAAAGGFPSAGDGDALAGLQA